VPETTVATPVLPLLHVPPVDTSVKVVEDPEQTILVPVMDDGEGLTVTEAVVVHPGIVV